MNPTALDQAAYELLEAKRREDEARNARLAAEERVIQILGTNGSEGTKRENTNWYKVSTVTSLTRTLHPEWRELLDDDDLDAETFSRVIKTEPKLSIGELKKVATENPTAYAVLARAIISKPAKIAVKVELQTKKEAA
ncbi:MAG: hypothetical protein EOM21_19525 [Gammaproteobacteria bacterium]|nr:hypothetical protein [Gammaproteobacteria bacterium]